MREERGTRPVRIANCSGFFGDRLAAAREQVEGGPIDVLTGDWLAELTMLILARQRMKHGAGAGYARTFLTQMQDVLGACLDRGIAVVTNAGGLDPQGLAEALSAQAAQSGLHPRIAVVTGDDLSGRLADLQQAGEPFDNFDTGESLAEAGVTPILANAYIGGRGITAALAAGADVVVTGRVTDAALAIGPAAWWHGWDYDRDFDQLAGAVVAGHVIECGAQATGGNYSFFAEVPGLEHPGFPIAEVAADGSCVITKHAGTGGVVSTGTVTAQLLYEVGGPLYFNPDATARFDTVRLDQVGPDRVQISGVRGLAPPPRLKVSMNYLGGFKNSMTLVLTGLDIEAKADLALRTVTGLSLADAAKGLSEVELAARSTLDVAELAVVFAPRDTLDAPDAARAQAHLHITVKDPDPKKVGKPFTSPVVESALSSYPGMFPTAPPGGPTPLGVYWPSTVSADAVRVQVQIGDELLDPLPAGGSTAVPTEPAEAVPTGPVQPLADGPATTGQRAVGDKVRLPLGRLVGARSGDKGGNANVGVWVPAGPLAPQVFAWLRDYLTPARVADLLPEAADLTIEVYDFPLLMARNIVVRGILGRGVADSSRLDPQAKGLAEQLRARLVDVPAALTAAARPAAGAGAEPGSSPGPAR